MDSENHDMETTYLLPGWTGALVAAKTFLEQKKGRILSYQELKVTTTVLK